MKDDNNFENTVDIFHILKSLWNKKVEITVITILLNCLFLVIILLQPNKYVSSASLAPANSSNNLSSISSQYSSIASITGISLSGSDDSDKVDISLEVIRSLEFFEKRIINKDDIFFNIMATSGWNPKKNKYKINKKIYDLENNKWVSKKKYSIDGKPSVQTSHKKFLEIFNFSRDKKSGFVYMSVEHYSPYFAQELLSIIINEINEITRQEDILQAKRSIEALNNEIENTQINEVVTGLNDLIQKQIEIITIANASPEYLFKVMSPPVALERKSSPKRSILAILFFLISFSAVCMVFLLKDFYKDSRKAI